MTVSQHELDPSVLSGWELMDYVWGFKTRKETLQLVKTRKAEKAAAAGDTWDELERIITEKAPEKIADPPLPMVTPDEYMDVCIALGKEHPDSSADDVLEDVKLTLGINDEDVQRLRAGESIPRVRMAAALDFDIDEEMGKLFAPGSPANAEPEARKAGFDLEEELLGEFERYETEPGKPEVPEVDGETSRL